MRDFTTHSPEHLFSIIAEIPPRDALDILNTYVMRGDYIGAIEVSTVLNNNHPEIWNNVFDLLIHGSTNGHLQQSIPVSYLKIERPTSLPPKHFM